MICLRLRRGFFKSSDRQVRQLQFLTIFTFFLSPPLSHVRDQLHSLTARIPVGNQTGLHPLTVRSRSYRVAALDCIALLLREPSIKLANLLRPRNAILHNEIDQMKQLNCDLGVVSHVQFTWMHLLVSDDSNNVQRLLDLHG